MTTHGDYRPASDKAPIVMLAAAAAVGGVLFVVCSAQQLEGSSLSASLPSLVGYGLVLLAGLPLFAASLTAVWRSQR